MIRILHLITDLDTGGSEIMLFRLLKHMDRSRFENIVISLKNNGTLGGDIEAIGIPVFALNAHRPLMAVCGIWKLLRIIRARRPNILQTWLYKADLLGLIAGKFMKLPAIIWNIRCSEANKDCNSRHISPGLRVLAKLSRMTDAIVVNSQAGRRVHEALGYLPSTWKFIPNGFDTDVFHPDDKARATFRRGLQLTGNSVLIGLIARFDPLKDHSNFLEAAGILARTRPDVRFLLAGKGVENSNSCLIEKIHACGIRRCTYLLGERSDISSIMPALDIACSSSFSEGFPNVLGEAMACGVPCVATDAGDSAYIIDNCGYIVPPRNPAGLAAAIGKLIDMNPEERKRLGLKGRKRIVENFRIEKITEQYEDFYAGIMRNIGAPS